MFDISSQAVSLHWWCSIVKTRKASREFPAPKSNRLAIARIRDECVCAARVIVL